ncbi:MAG: amino acid permease [Planctomycetes bacterium]|nr:amino acid permease [Planctomycetota bacterium]
MPDELQDNTEPSSLKRELGLLSVFSIVSGTMISSGLFVLPGPAYKLAGPAVILSYAIASVLIIPVMFSKMELGTAMPRSGGSYFFIDRSLGPLAGTVAGLANWLSISLKAAFALVGMGALAASLLITDDPRVFEAVFKAVAVAGCIFFGIINLFSSEGTGRLQVVMVFGLLFAIVIFVVAGILYMQGPEIGPAVIERYVPFAPHGWGAVFAVAGMVFVSYGGLTKVVDVSEEIRNPARNLPLGIFLAFLIVSTLYVVVVSVTVATVDGSILENSLVPISLGAQVSMGKWGAIIISAGALFAFATTANAGILSASRSPLAMSRDGLLPKFFSVIGSRSGTPYVSILITMLFIIFVVVFLSIENLIKTASTMFLVMFMLENLSIMIMRHSGIQNYRPTFRVPFYPWLQIFAIIIYGFLIAEMGEVPIILTTGFAALAGVWYLAYVGRKINRESAFVYLVKNILARDFSRSGLEEELKQITIERDEIQLDRFDRLVKEAVVLDLDGAINAKEFFTELSAALAPRINLAAEQLYHLFLKRERESSTVMRPGLAIPHVIVEGKEIFDLALVRCREGITFSELHQPVTTVFVLIGSQDERNYHLRALMSIAHIVEEEGFDKRWLDARGIENLRDVVLLSGRRRG